MTALTDLPAAAWTDRSRPRHASRVTSVGWRVALEQPWSGSVHSVFPRAINFLIEGQMWTLLHQGAPDSPLGLRLDNGVMPGDLGAKPGDPVRGRARFVSIGPAVVDCRTATRWVPTPPNRYQSGWHARFLALRRFAHASAWSGAADLATEVTDALAEGRESPSLQAAVDAAVGRGPGLTPAGDDVLIGLLATLHLARPSTDHQGYQRITVARSRLMEAWHNTPSRTSDLSRHLLDDAVTGAFGAAVHGLLSALACTNDGAIRRAADVLLAIGASSGADTCVGVIAGGNLLSAPAKKGHRCDDRIAHLPQLVQGLGISDDRLG
jgi:hypothetical protein